MIEIDLSDKESHFIILPVSHLVCGKPHLSTYRVTFKFDENEHGNGAIEVLTMTEHDENGYTYDVKYIMEEGTKNLDNTIINCIYYNQDYWDIEGAWWRGEVDNKTD